MAVLQTKHALRQEAAVSSYEVGCTITQTFVMPLTSVGVTAAADKIELGMLPAEAQIVGATLIGEGLGAITASVGIMSGDFGSSDNARTVGTQLFSAQSVNDTEANATRKNCLAVAPTSGHRSIGATLSANVVAGAGKKLTLVLEYVF